MENDKTLEVRVGNEIRRRRQALKLTIDQLVDRIEALGGKADQGNISRIERNQQGCTQETLSYVALALECKIADLFLGVEGINNFDTIVPQGNHRVPVIDYKQAAMWGRITTKNKSMDLFKDYVITDFDVSKNSFAIRIKGDSMADLFSDGDVVIVDTALEPLPGDFVVAINHEEEATFMKYRPRGANEKGEHVFELVPLNDDYPTIRSDVSPMEIIGVMVEHRRYRKKRA
jgi:SOS-response transcriptional repressor LexA